ncbi:MAG: type VII secretion integral membrane protein EccD [Micromonosporaceae bacterium]|nr:type VII secretion integral membrane protein EccD [Micromonosporaceae bacterium]
MPPATTGLARVTVSAPYRRIDVALPEGAPIAELLPDLLRHAGDDLAGDGEQHGGWLLRRADGLALDTSSTLLSQGIRDGAVLHLVPATTHWPELEYDDIVETIAEGAKRSGVGWSSRATRAAGLVAAGAAAFFGVVGLWTAGPAWRPAAVCALILSALLVTAGMIASRAYGDGTTGAALAAYGLPYALFGGGLILAPSDAFEELARTERASFLLVGSIALVLASLVSAVGVGRGLPVFTCAGATGILGAAGALLALWLPAVSTAAVLLTVLVTGTAGVPLLALRLGSLPMPRSAPPAEASAIEDDPVGLPDRSRVFVAVVRTEQLLTGLLMTILLVGTITAYLVAALGGVSGRILVCLAATAFLLRARLFIAARQRWALLASGIAGFVVLAVVALFGPDRVTGTVLGVTVGAGLALLAMIVATASVRYAKRAPSPYLGRAADALDALCVVSMVPCACAVLGLYGLARGIAG